MITLDRSRAGLLDAIIHWRNGLKYLLALLAIPLLQGCTVLAIADAAASTVIYGVKTTVNVIDAITPDIVNKDKKKDGK